MYIQAKRYKMFHVEHFFDFAAQPPSFRSTGRTKASASTLFLPRSTPSTPPPLLLPRPRSEEARKLTPRADVAADTVAGLSAGCPCRCRGPRVHAAARPGVRGLRTFRPREWRRP